MRLKYPRYRKSSVGHFVYRIMRMPSPEQAADERTVFLSTRQQRILARKGLIGMRGRGFTKGHGWLPVRVQTKKHEIMVYRDAVRRRAALSTNTEPVHTEDG